MKASEQARFHRITAICCGREILRFDTLDKAPVLLAQDAVSLGWVMTRNGDWVCNEHQQECE